MFDLSDFRVWALLDEGLAVLVDVEVAGLRTTAWLDCVALMKIGISVVGRRVAVWLVM